MEHYIIWLIVVVVAAIIEGITLGLASIWLIPAGLIVLVLSLFGTPLWVEVTVFITLTVLSFVFLYPLAKKKLKLGHVKTNYEAAIGKKGVVIITIDNMKAEGQVKLDGQIWSAKSNILDKVIKKDKEVKVLNVKGVKLIVEEIKEV